MRLVLKMNRPMYDPKFEKAIQEKMGELEFRPAESVWVNIEKAVVEDRRRRGAGFFWRFLLAGLFLAAATGGYVHYFTGKTAKAPKTADARRVDPGQAMADRGDGAGATADHNGAGAMADRNGAGARPEGMTGGGSQGTANNGIAGYEGPAGRSMGSRQRQTERNLGVSGAAANGGIDQTGAGDEQANMRSNDRQPGTGSVEKAVNGQKSRFDWFYMPGLVDLRLSPQVYGAALNTKKNGISVAALSRKKYHWEAGFAGGAGWSTLNKLNANQAPAAVTRMAASLYSITGSSSSKNYISETRPGASFEGGIYLQRPLSRRWLVNTGMYLHYYSNSISVGQPLSTYVNASASYFTPTAQVAGQSTTMYASGNLRSYTNRYYFLELPVGLQWKVSQNKVLPVFLEGGVSLSRLMGADALFYNAKTGLYSKDGQVVNKTQFNISSALLFGLPFHGVGIQVGPQIQYGLTPLINTQGVGDQHFLYTGVRLVVIPGRR